MGATQTDTDAEPTHDSEPQGPKWDTLNKQGLLSCAKCDFVPDEQSPDRGRHAIFEHVLENLPSHSDGPIDDLDDAGFVDKAGNRGAHAGPEETPDGIKVGIMSDSERRADRLSNWFESSADELGAVGLMLIVPLIGLAYNVMGVPHGAFDAATIDVFYAAAAYLFGKKIAQGGASAYRKRQE